MFITGLELKGFLRLVHNNINEVKVDFTSLFQIILGRNGSGKSSLMGELTPYPSHKDLYADGGYRKLFCNHRGSEYIIFDDFSSSSPKHSIWKDGDLLHENLNPSMAKNVVKELFGLDRTLVDILTDRKKFTTMSPNERREIIMRASGINIDLGLEMLDKFKERRSYFKEYSKNLSKRLVAEDNSLPSESHIAELEKRKEDILADLNLLDEMSNQPVEIISERDMLEKIGHLEKIGKTVAYRFLDTPIVLNKASNMEDVIEIATRLKYQIDEIENKKKSISDEIETLSVSLGKNRFSKNKEDLEKEKNYIKQEMDDIIKISKGFLYKDLNSHHNAVNTAQTLYEDLRSIFDDLFDNSSRFFNIEKKQQNTEELIQLNNRVSILRQSVFEIETQLKQHKDGESIECPACKNNFIPGVQLSETVLKERLQVNLELLARAEKLLEEKKTYDTEYNSYIHQLETIETLSRHFEVHSFLFKKLKEYNYTENSPKGCSSIIEAWFSDIGKSLRYNELVTRLMKVDDDLYRISLVDLERKRLDDEKLLSLEKEYSELIDLSLKGKESLKTIKGYVSYIKELTGFLKDAMSLTDEVEDYKENLLKNNLHRFVFNAKADLHRELNNIEKEITNIQYTIQNRENLSQDKTETDLNVELLSILHDELSPKTGLLGDVMNEFIEKFVTQMNNLIKPIWTYDVKILPCRNKKGDLDYYFPIQIMGGKPANDVSETSTGEGHICNFVFKLLIMATYDLKDFPLFLDELAGNMDDLHRVRIMKTIYDMVVNNYCTQMFLIAHYQQQYGVFTQAEVLVTNPENLQTIPENANLHAKFC